MTRLISASDTNHRWALQFRGPSPGVQPTGSEPRPTEVDRHNKALRNALQQPAVLPRTGSQTGFPQMKQPPVVQGVAGGCTKVRNPLVGVDGNRADSLNHIVGNTLRDPVFGSAAECAAVGDEYASDDPDLAQVIEVWDTLPPDTRTAILAIVEAAQGR